MCLSYLLERIKKERLVDNYDEIYNERKGFKDNDGEGNGCN